MKALTALALIALLAGPARADMADQALSLINQHRAAHGCAALTREPALQDAAAAHASDMATGNFVSHTGAGGSKPLQRMRARGFDGLRSGENIAAGQATAAEVVQNWMSSKGHRKNILNCKYNVTGLAVVYQADDAPLKGSRHALNHYWVQTFGGN